MADCIVRRSVLLDVPIEQAFAFIGNPHNVSKISPAWQSVRVLRAETTPRPGEEFELSIRFFGLLQTNWICVWREVQPPHLLMDEARPGKLFVFWQHRHEFRAIDAHHAEMTDCLTYRLSEGWLGKVLGLLFFGRWQFYLMFLDRQTRIRRWLRQHGEAMRAVCL
jgi:ligand-binding SRPBCC domain-containing protein